MSLFDLNEKEEALVPIAGKMLVDIFKHAQAEGHEVVFNPTYGGETSLRGKSQSCLISKKMAGSFNFACLIRPQVIDTFSKRIDSYAAEELQLMNR